MAELRDVLAKVVKNRKSENNTYGKGWNEAMQKVADAIEAFEPEQPKVAQEWAIRMGNGMIRRHSISRDMVVRELEGIRHEIHSGHFSAAEYEPMELVRKDTTPQSASDWIVERV